MREKNASGRGKKESSESGTIGGRKLTQVMKHASVIAMAKQNRACRRTVTLVKREHDRAAHVANSPATKTTGWRSLRLRARLSPLYPAPQPLQAFHRHPRLGPYRGRQMMVTHPTRT